MFDVNWVITTAVAIFKRKSVCVLEFCYVITLLSWNRSRFESAVGRQ